MKRPATPVALRTPATTKPGREALLAAARAAARQAYCPYSRFRVGAALLAADGRVFTGCNVENASFGLTVCAERVALVKAISEGVRAFAALAVVGGRSTPATPCGACRQVLFEFCPAAMPIYLAPLGAGPVKRVTLKRLLPMAFELAASTQP
jgi:cytidine deaminase